MELRGVDAAAPHLRGDRVEPLLPARDLGGDARLRQAFLQLVTDLPDHPLGPLEPPIDLPLDARELLGLQVLESQVLELALEQPHAQAVGDRRVDVHRLARDLAPLFGREVLERAHVVEPVGELDEDHAQVRDHRQDHLAEGLGLLLLPRDVGELADLRQAVDQVGHLRPELLRDRLLGRQRVLEDVVQQPDDDRHVVGLHVRQDRGHVERVDEVRLAGAPVLAPVLPGREHVGPPEQVLVALRVVGLDPVEDVLEADHRKRVAGLPRDAGATPGRRRRRPTSAGSSSFSAGPRPRPAPRPPSAPAPARRAPARPSRALGPRAACRRNPSRSRRSARPRRSRSRFR